MPASVKLMKWQDVPTKARTNAVAARKNGMQYRYLGRGSAISEVSLRWVRMKQRSISPYEVDEVKIIVSRMLFLCLYGC